MIASGAVGSRCDTGRHDPWPVDDLPAARVYFNSEQIDAITLSSPRRFRRNLTAIIEIVLDATGIDLIDDLADTASEAINDELEGDRKLNNLVKDCIPVGVAFEFSDNGSRPMARIEMEYNVEYETLETA